MEKFILKEKKHDNRIRVSDEAFAQLKEMKDRTGMQICEITSKAINFAYENAEYKN